MRPLLVLCLVHAVYGNQAMVFPDLDVAGPLVSAPAGSSGVVAMDSDESHVYAATSRQIIKMKSQDLLSRKIIDMGDAGVREIAALQEDGDDIFLTAKTMNRDNWVLMRLSKTDLEVQCQREIDPQLYIPYALAIAGPYAYTGHFTFPGKVVSEPWHVRGTRLPLPLAWWCRHRGQLTGSAPRTSRRTPPTPRR